jgi:hypothetical protein
MKVSYKKTFQDLEQMEPSAPKEMKQERGRKFEYLLNDVFNEEGILHKRTYHTKDNKSEQIDGAIEVYNRIFLFEIKWVSSDLAASELYAFIGKIENKFHGTLGVFISRKKLSENFLNALSKGRRQSVIVIHGDDINLFFENENLTFSEYIEFAFKELSCDNIVHLPVSKFLQIKESQVEEKKVVNVSNAVPSDKEARDFIKNTLAKGPIAESDLVMELEGLTKEVKDKIYEIILKQYNIFFNSNLIGGKPFFIPNIDNFIKCYNPEEGVLKEFAKEYFGGFVPKSLGSFHRQYFLDVFKRFYKDLPIHNKEEFEKLILKEWNPRSTNYYLENQITDIIRPIWKDFSEATRRKLNKGYLDIYVSGRTDKHSQKKFANFLVTGNYISKDEIEEWLMEKITKSNSAYTELGIDSVAMIIHTYEDILKLIVPNPENWLSYVKDKLVMEKQTETISRANNKIKITANQIFQFLEVRAINNFDLITSKITVDITREYGANGQQSASRTLTSLVPDLPYQRHRDKLIFNKSIENGKAEYTEISFSKLEENQIEVVFRILDSSKKT